MMGSAQVTNTIWQSHFEWVNYRLTGDWKDKDEKIKLGNYRLIMQILKFSLVN